MHIEIIPVEGLPEISPGDDLAGALADRAPVRDGDVLVVTSKIVSKADGRLVEVDPLSRGEARQEWAEREARRIVARRGDLIIAETAHGFVCAAAGVDGSNLSPDRLALLPTDPDGSASRIRQTLRAEREVDVAVVVSDTFGRPWRAGQTNVAIGVAGLLPMRDHRGEKDSYGTLLEATVIAVADEIAGAAELVMGKTEEVPAAIVRGLPRDSFGIGSSRELLRAAEEDLFRTSAVDAVEGRRSIRRFDGRAVPGDILRRAVAAAATAPAPHGSRTQRPWRFVLLHSPDARASFITELARAWRRDMEADRTPEAAIARRLTRSRTLLTEAPVLLACFVGLAGSDRYSDARRILSEREMFVAAAGAAVQNLMVSLSTQGVGSCWLSTSLFCNEEAAAALGLGLDWQAVGCVIAGYSTEEPAPRPPLNASDYLDIR